MVVGAGEGQPRPSVTSGGGRGIMSHQQPHHWPTTPHPLFPRPLEPITVAPLQRWALKQRVYK